MNEENKIILDARPFEVALKAVRAAMADAWDEGAKAQADAYGMQVDTAPNPYREANE